MSSNTLFVNGGGGSVFSRAGLLAMKTERCVNNSMPGQARAPLLTLPPASPITG